MCEIHKALFHQRLERTDADNVAHELAGHNTRIAYTRDTKIIEVRFSNAPVVHQFTGEVIADVNRLGNWVRGLEVIGSGLPFSLERALASLSPQSSAFSVPHSPDKLTVTYKSSGGSRIREKCDDKCDQCWDGSLDEIWDDLS
jgi:hypothetical protein